MNWLTLICKNLGLLAPFLTGLGAVLGLLFKVWQWKRKTWQPRKDKDMDMAYGGYGENPDLITISSKLDVLESQQNMIMEMNDTLTTLVKSVITRLDTMDARITDLDNRLEKVEGEEK